MQSSTVRGDAYGSPEIKADFEGLGNLKNGILLLFIYFSRDGDTFQALGLVSFATRSERSVIIQFIPKDIQNKTSKLVICAATVALLQPGCTVLVDDVMTWEFVLLK